eukprot:1159895-Pelagomonas_calceolata.AAC.7
MSKNFLSCSSKSSQVSGQIGADSSYILGQVGARKFQGKLELSAPTATCRTTRNMEGDAD